MLRLEAYRVLGLDPETPVEDVKAHFRRLVKQMHPDGASSVSHARAVDLGSVVEAYRTLAESSTGAAVRKPTEHHGAPSWRQAPQGRRARRGGAPPNVFSLGRLATKSSDAAVRLRAVELLGSLGKRAAGVYLRQAIFDTDPSVARAAATAFAHSPGRQVEQELLELFDQLTVEQRLAVLRSLHGGGSTLNRLVAYATADPNPSVRRLAQEIMQ